MQALLVIVSGCDQVSAPKERRGAEGSALLRASDPEFPHFGLERGPFHPRRVVVSSVSMPAIVTSFDAFNSPTGNTYFKHMEFQEVRSLAA